MLVLIVFVLFSHVSMCLIELSDQVDCFLEFPFAFPDCAANWEGDE